jgi:hypothetical protein
MAGFLLLAGRKFETTAFQYTTYCTHMARHGDTTTQHVVTSSGHSPNACRFRRPGIRAVMLQYMCKIVGILNKNIDGGMY